MKRFAFWFVVAVVAVAAVRSNHRHYPPPHDERVSRTVVHRDGRRFISVESNGKHVVIDGNVVTVNDRGRVLELKDDESDGDDDRHGRVVVDGLPVPVIPGTRVTEAKAEPPKPPTPPRPAKVRIHAARRTPPKPPTPPAVPALDDAKAEPLVVTGLLSATEDRARTNAFARFEKVLADKLRPDVPPTWKVPERLVKGLKPEVTVTPHPRDYGTMYTAEVSADFKPSQRNKIVSAYRQEQRVEKMTLLGGILAFVLVCLGVLSGYIRADEATKGYYTNKLRLAAAAGVGASGVLIYQWIA